MEKAYEPSIFVLVVKVLIAIFFSFSAARAAASSVEKASCGKKKMSKGDFATFSAMWLAIGLTGMAPEGFTVQIIALIMVAYLSFKNTEGWFRAVSWALLAAQSGLLLAIDIFSMQQKYGGVRKWVFIPIIIAVVLVIVAALVKGYDLEHLAADDASDGEDEGEEEKTVADKTTEIKEAITAKATSLKEKAKKTRMKTAIAVVCICIFSVGLISAGVWLVSLLTS